LVQILKSKGKKGKKRVYKTDLQAKYGTDMKRVVIEQTDVYPDLLQKYKEENSAPTSALSHWELSQAMNTDLPDWKKMFETLKNVRAGKEDAHKYEDAIVNILEPLFYPYLVDPDIQTPLHNGLKRVDITFTNNATTGFFNWLSRSYKSQYVLIECKNFSQEVGNPELDQLAMRMSSDRGKFGILICRNIENRKTLLDRCKAILRDDKKYIIVLDDNDLIEISKSIGEAIVYDGEFKVLKKYFKELVF
jgi:hypothetical protein